MSPLLMIAIDSAREAGAVIMSLYESAQFETKKDGSPVTEADLRANEILHTHLLKTGIPILSEESAGISFPYRDRTPFTKTAQGLANVPSTFSPYPERLWVIDPIDGTIGFVKKTGDFAVMIALLEEGRPTIGVVYSPSNDTLYYAEKGTGAFMERAGTTSSLTVSTRDANGLRFLRSVNHFTPIMQAVANAIQSTEVPQGSVGLKAGKLAEEKGDFFFSEGALGEWDVCAPEIITSEAGGLVTDFNGEPLFYGTEDHRIKKGMVFSNHACHEKVLSAIHDVQK